MMALTVAERLEEKNGFLLTSKLVLLLLVSS